VNVFLACGTTDGCSSSMGLRATFLSANTEVWAGHILELPLKPLLQIYFVTPVYFYLIFFCPNNKSSIFKLTFGVVFQCWESNFTKVIPLSNSCINFEQFLFLSSRISSEKRYWRYRSVSGNATPLLTVVIFSNSPYIPLAPWPMRLFSHGGRLVWKQSFLMHWKTNRYDRYNLWAVGHVVLP